MIDLGEVNQAIDARLVRVSRDHELALALLEQRLEGSMAAGLRELAGVVSGLEEELEACERRVMRELELALAAYGATFRAELERHREELDARITSVHERALRALTHLIEGRK